jgi:uncharacterized protein
MKIRGLLALLIASVSMQTMAENQHYPINRDPLLQTAFVSLPLGSVQPQGWLKDQLQIQADGLTGHLSDFWPSIRDSKWKGDPEGEEWERGPYWLDGAVPLAFLLDDKELLSKIQPYMDFILSSGQDHGWFGPQSGKDRWPLAVALKVLTQYHEATHDPRALNIILNYGRFIANTPPDWPDRDWRGMRAMENLPSLYWAYRRTGDPDMLKAAKSIQNNCFDWARYFLEFPWDSEAILKNRIPHNWGPVGMTAHVVNVAMAVKYPSLWYQQARDPLFKEAQYAALTNLDRHHGQVAGRISGDEHLSGTNPTQGTELCSVVELMYSLENMMEVLGDVQFADHLELLAYNANPGTCTADYWAHQYDQQSNQVLCSVAPRAWSTNGDASNLYGLEPNYGCCTSNMHQGWPKFVKHLWMATHDNGLAVMAYGPSTVTATVAGGVQATITETTNYPFDGAVRFTINVPKPTTFPLHLRIPTWAEGTTITVGDAVIKPQPGTFCAVERVWNYGDTILMNIPMKLRTETRYNDAVSILRGPLYFSLKIGEERKIIKKHHETLPVYDYEIYPTTPWNYALALDRAHPENSISVITKKVDPVPFATEAAPVTLTITGRQIPGWGMEKNSAGETPLSPVKSDQPETQLELIPYGSTRLRITEFPILH